MKYNESHFIVILQNHTYIGESVRKIKMGEFRGNVAKSCKYSGMRFNYHESGEEVVLSQMKLIKNRYRGLYLYSSYNITLEDSLFAENSQYNIEIRWSDNIKIEDSIIRGYTAETKAMVKPPYFNQLCTHDFKAPIGLKIPTAIHQWSRTDNIGTTLTNVLFTDFDHSQECDSIIPIGFGPTDNNNNHFDYLTMFKNVTIDGSKIMDALSSDEEGVKDVMIHDIDGATNPNGLSNSGMLVRDVKWLKDFQDACTKHPNGMSYCPDTCYRTLSLFVDQTDSDMYDLRVKRVHDGKETLVPFTYKHDNDQHLKQYYLYHRIFSVSLPEGYYQVEFLQDLQPVWPRFALTRWEGIPSCPGYVSQKNVTVVEPLPECDGNLIINGDAESGTYYWYHRNSRSTTSGELLAVPGEGIDGSTALRHYNRSSGYAGIGQNLDTRCLHERLDEFYEIELYFRLENGTTPFICDPYDSTWEVRCPLVTFQQQKYVDGVLESRYINNRANVIIPNDLGDLNLIHGVFRVDQEIYSLQRVFMYLEYAHQDYDIIMDNVSVKKLPGICGTDLIRNGDFDENGKYWKTYGTAKLDVALGSNNALKTYGKSHPDYGPQQELYIDKSCFHVKDRYAMFGKCINLLNKILISHTFSYWSFIFYFFMSSKQASLRWKAH